MNLQGTGTTTKIKKETLNKIRVDFERTSRWTKFRIKYLSMNFLTNFIWKIVRFVLLLGISYVILQPFYAKIASSFMSGQDFVDVTVKLIPKYPTLDTYKAIISDNGYYTAFINTLTLSLLCAVIQTLICSSIAYGFAKFKFKGNGLLFALVILTMIVPHKTLQFSMFMKFRYFDILGIFKLLGGEVIENFRFITFSSLNLTNKYWPLAILSFTGLGFKNGLFIFMLRQFFRGVPEELEESAYIDGYGPFRTFIKIIFPISVPMMITVFLFSFSWQWTDNFYTRVFFTTLGPVLMPTIIKSPDTLKDAMTIAPTMYSAAVSNTCALMIITPLIVMYLFCQRFLIQGIERSGITG